MAIEVGQEAPHLELPVAGSQDKFRLSDYRGKQPVVLLFFPLAWTGICVNEMCAVRDTLGQYDALGAKVVGISVDSPFALAKFKEDQNLNFDLASDFNKTAAAAYGALFEELIGLKGVAKRSAFVVGRDGKVKFATVSDDPKQLPDFAQIQEALKGA